MSDVDNKASVQADLAAELEATSEQSEEVKSDAGAEETTDIVEESAAEEEIETTSEEETADPEKETAEEPKEEPKFDFRDTPTSIQNLVTKLSAMSEADRQEKISKLTRGKEIEAVKAAYPDYFQTEAPISRKDIEAINEKLARLEKLEQLDSTRELLNSIQSAKPQLEETLRNRMLKEQFGEEFKEIIVDPKFISSYDKYPTMDLEDRLEYACSMSPTARQLAMSGELEKEARTIAARIPAKGQKVQPKKKEVTAQELLTAEGMERELGAMLENVSFD